MSESSEERLTREELIAAFKRGGGKVTIIRAPGKSELHTGPGRVLSKVQRKTKITGRQGIIVLEVLMIDTGATVQITGNRALFDNVNKGGIYHFRYRLGTDGAPKNPKGKGTLYYTDFLPTPVTLGIAAPRNTAT